MVAQRMGALMKNLIFLSDLNHILLKIPVEFWRVEYLMLKLHGKVFGIYIKFIFFEEFC